MRNIFRWLLGIKQDGSGVTASNRMKTMLVNDRFQLPQGVIEQLRQEFLSVAARYFEVDLESSECVIKSLGDRKAFISATVPLLGRGIPKDANTTGKHNSSKASRRNSGNFSSTAS